MTAADRLFKTAIAPYSAAVQMRLAQLRALVLSTAAETDGVGAVEETLKWNQFSFLTPETGSGSTIRIDGLRRDPEKLALFVHCQSGLIDEFKRHYAGVLQFEGDRAIVLGVGKALPATALRHCISLALTHHLRKNPGRTQRARGQRAIDGQASKQTGDHHRHRPRTG